MNEKDFNLAFLLKLYEIAEAVWAKMAKVADYGSYSAKDICKGLNKDFCFSLEQNRNEKITIKHETFACSFPLEGLFNYITVFERLSGIGKNAKQFVFEEAGEILGSATLELTKGMAEVCNFVAKDELRPVMNYIILDASAECLVASDGHKLISYPVRILERSGDLSDFYIDPQKLALMCKKMKKNVPYKVEATKLKVSGKEYSKVSFDGVTSNMHRVGCYPNWSSVIQSVSNELSLQVGCSWKEIKGFIKSAAKAGEYEMHLGGIAGNNYISLWYGDNKRDFAIENKVQYNFVGNYKTDSLKAFEQVDTIYYGKGSEWEVTLTNNLGNIYLLMPVPLNKGEKYHNIKDITFDKNLLVERANNRAESIESAKVVSSVTEQKEERTEQKNEPQRTKVAKVSNNTLDADAKKFTFDKVGINVGDMLTFVDGTEVIAAEDNKVSFCGELFTLSGFCKEFMPDGKRTKSNAYRGCDYFYKDGVKLGKLLKEYQKNVAATLDSTPSEQEQTEETTAKVVKLSSASVETTERTITPSAKDIAAERKKNVPKANFVPLDIGTLTKVVTISLGVPPEYGVAASGALPIIEPPNEGVRLVGVGSERFTSDVGSCLGVAGKVVHTLPLPPPQGKRNIKSLSFICYVRRNSKQSKEGSLRVHRETKEMYWRFGGMQPP